MCYNASQRRIKEKEELEFKRRLKGEDIEFKPIAYYVSGHTHPKLATVLSESPEEVSYLNWGLVPFWVKDKEQAKKSASFCLNAIGEEIFDKPSYRIPIRKQRCVIPINGFFEWMDVKKVKFPHYIFLKDREIFSVAGVYDNWVDKETGEVHRTFSMVTTAANPLMERIHNLKKRMPLILQRDDIDKWLDNTASEKAIKDLIKIFPDDTMDAYTISRRITSKTEPRNVPEILSRFDYPELSVA
jgi:putative SOS response-associated peptidase YedK